jgi:hypothetical protein
MKKEKQDIDPNFFFNLAKLFVIGKKYTSQECLILEEFAKFIDETLAKKDEVN